MQPNPSGHPRRWLILSVLVVSLLVVILDTTVLNVALRVIADPQRGLGASQGDLEWATNSYTLVFAGLLFTWGVLGDRLGRKKVLLAGLIIFGLASAASAYAHSPAELIWARAVMGVGGAAVLPATLAIISNVFDPRERARAIGAWAGAVGLGVAIGPVIGGLLLEHFWWGSVFLLNVPIVVIGVVAIAGLVPDSRDPRPGRLDVAGVLLSIAGLVLLVYGIIDGGEHGFSRPQSWGAIAGGVVVLVLFVLVERRIPYPSLDVRLFREPRFSAAVASVGLVFFAAMGSMFFLAFYLQLVRGYSPLTAGLMVTPFAVAQLVFAPTSASMVRRFGPKAVCAVGVGLLALSQVALIFVGAHTPIWQVGAIFFFQGAGMANVMPPSTESIMSSLPREKAGVGSAVANTLRQVAGALGVAVLGAVVAAEYRSGMRDQVAGLPSGVRAAAGDSISGTHAVGPHLGAAGQAVVAAGDSTFIHAMHVAGLGSVVAALLGLVVVLGWLPRRSVVQPSVPAPEAATPLDRVELVEV
jgi:MFS transporter, DHA2 family, multidrug resistance protein